MDDEWDKDNFDPEPKVPAAVDKWEGEDEDDDVKDNWEDEEEEKEEKKDVEKQEDDLSTKAIQVKKSKKTLSEKIEEKERLAKEEMEKKLQEKIKKSKVLEDDDEEVKKPLTPEERLAEKLHRQKLQEEADLRVALETFGLTGEPSTGTGLESTPSTEEEFNEYKSLLTAKLDSLAKSTYFPDFAEEIVKNISLNLPLTSLKKLKSVTEAICTEKLKLEKGDKAKKKGKGKAQLRLEGNTNLMNEYSAYKDLEDYDDFM